MSDIECPYCGAEQEICHDDGHGYEEGTAHEDECGECGKAFVFYTSISLHYEACKADCLNGEPHQWGKPRLYWHDEDKKQNLWGRRCKDCDERERGYDPEWAEESL